MTTETLELVNKLSLLKKDYELKLSKLEDTKRNPKISICVDSLLKTPGYCSDGTYDFHVFELDNEIVEVIKEYCKKKIEYYNNQIENL